MEAIARVGQWVKAASYPMGEGMPTNGNEGTWYLTPERLVVEGAVVALLSAAVISLVDQKRRVWLPARRSSATWLDWVVGTVLIACFVLIAVWKGLSGLETSKIGIDRTDTWERVWFMLMPCHSLCLLMGVTSFLSGPWADAAFNFNIHLLFFPFLGIVTPDTRGYQWPGEVEAYWIEHYTLLAMPFLAVLQRRFNVWAFSLRTWLVISTIVALHFFAVLTPVSLARGLNLNFMLSPPQSAIIVSMGPWYRLLFSAVCFSFALFSRLSFGLAASVLAAARRGIVGDDRDSKKKQKKA